MPRLAASLRWNEKILKWEKDAKGKSDGGKKSEGTTYTVQRGDTLYSIAMAFGVDVRELARTLTR